MSYSIEIASVSDREKLVAEIWLDDNMIAEINHENENLELQIYSEEKMLSVNYDDFILILEKAKKLLMKEV